MNAADQMGAGTEPIFTGLAEACEELAKKAAVDRQRNEWAAASYAPVETGFAELAEEVPAKAAAKEQQNEQPGANADPAKPSEQQQASSTDRTKQSDTSLPLDFLDDFFGADKRHLVAIRKNKGKKPDIKAHHFDADDRAEQQKFITEYSAAGFDLYFGPNPIKGTLHKKATKNDIAEARHLWIDLDPRPGEPLEAERAAMLALLTTDLPQGMSRPNRVIDSGRGYWGYWKLATPQPVDGSRTT